MAESDNRYINGVNNGWLGDCIIVSAVKCNHKITQISTRNCEDTRSQRTEVRGKNSVFYSLISGLVLIL